MVNLQQKKNMKDRFRYVSRRDKQTRFGRNNKAGPAEMRARFCHNLVPLVLLVGAVLVPCAITTLRMLGEASVPLLGSSAELLEDKPFGVSASEKERLRNQGRETFPALSVTQVGPVDCGWQCEQTFEQFLSSSARFPTDLDPLWTP